MKKGNMDFDEGNYEYNDNDYQKEKTLKLYMNLAALKTIELHKNPCIIIKKDYQVLHY